MSKNAFTITDSPETGDHIDNRLLIEMWSDLICPWCGIGERHLGKALDAFPHRDKVQLSLRSYRLMPGDTPQPVEQVLESKYAMYPKEAAESIHKLETLGAQAGLRYNLAGSWAGDTMDGHRLIKLAAAFGNDIKMYHCLFSAAMSRRLPVHVHSVLRSLALETGLDAAAVDAVLSGDKYRDAVEADEKVMREYCGRGVPFFVFNKRYDYSGALEPEIFLNAMHKAWRDNEKDATSSIPAGVVCGPDGCYLPPREQ